MKLPARAQRVDEPSPGALVLELYAAGEKAYLVVAPALTPALELRGARPRGEEASPFVRKLRKHLVGARLVRVRAGGHTVALDFEARAPLSLVGDRREGLSLFRDGRVIVGSRGVAAPGAELGEVDLGSLRASPESDLVGRGREAEREARRAVVRRAGQRALARLERKRRAIEGDLARVSDAGTLRAEAEALLLHLRELARGETEVTLELPDGALRTIRLDPRRTPREEVEHRFKRARALERGATIATARLDEVTRERDALVQTLASVDAADEARLFELEAELAPSTEGVPPRRARKGPPPRLPYRRFVSRDGMEILVGRSAADNDALTLRIARPGDLFVHARGVTGSHVIVRNDRAEVPVETLLDAATLAVHFSAAAREPSAEVQYAERRYVRKGRGLPPGAVRVDRERVLLLHVQDERLRRLLDARERSTTR